MNELFRGNECTMGGRWGGRMEGRISLSSENRASFQRCENITFHLRALPCGRVKNTFLDESDIYIYIHTSIEDTREENQSGELPARREQRSFLNSRGAVSREIVHKFPSGVRRFASSSALQHTGIRATRHPGDECGNRTPPTRR